jgi:peptidoglycan/xylan/chitin deacetylase (PgdA/CDA1 family)
MIWRDDDIGAAQTNHAGIVIPGTKLSELQAADDLFQRYGVPHTIAVIAKDLDTRPDLIDLIRERGMNVQLHCWTHDDLTVDESARDDLERARDLVATLFGRAPAVLYPPWNRCNNHVMAAAARLGMRVSHRKVSLEQFIRFGGDVEERTVNFHHWDVDGDMQLLELALHIEAALQ